MSCDEVKLLEENIKKELMKERIAKSRGGSGSGNFDRIQIPDPNPTP
jgi:hypothetical protein